VLRLSRKEDECKPLVTGDMPAADDPTFHGSTAGLVTVRPTMPAIEVFELMCRLKISGVGVTGMD